ncbi:gamma-glutamyltransferase [Sinosporangium siamense]|uniref:Gamma-glutamyltranspeptidase n=1 Tax=Sinosporangium siamense TaxID=1367973 RepID=A0A919RGH1_9ACTN|nr:gamma-glutamyltransferase [Sinosporangium siamense]GII92330.1 gamma-glutamyltranspeptidase [Sinosporangium siamense]
MGGAMVASSHPGVSLAGARVLDSGGNAVDAALAMAAMSWVALPGQCGVGGDAFALLRRPDGTVVSFGGSGFGPDGGWPGFYRDRGLAAIPLEGALAVAVPGAVAALAELHKAAATRDLEELWAPAIAAAARGLPCTVKTHLDIVEHETALAKDAGAAAVFLPRGRPLRAGEPLVQAELAATLRRLAGAPGAFYTGALAERAVAALTAGGAPFSGEEWAAGGSALIGPSVTVRYQGLTVHQTPLPTPGWMVLQQAGLCDGELSRLPWLSAEAVHWAAGAARIAFADRLAACASGNDRWQELLTPASLASRRRRIDRGEVTGLAPSPVPFDGDTTSVVAVDATGQAVTLIHSLAFTFGARASVPETGVLLNNRLGRGAYLRDGHPNEVAPRRRPLHTLNAWIVTDEAGRLRHVGNTPGGDGQVQWNMQLLSHLIDHGANPAEAVGAPRFTVFPGSDADVLARAPELRCESRLGGAALERLRELGHDVVTQGAWAAGGSALVISAGEEPGVLLGAADPRQDGVALGV